MMHQLTLFAVLLLISSLTFPIAAVYDRRLAEQCVAPGVKIKLEVVVALDRSHSFKNMTKIFSEKSPTLLKSLQKKFPGSKFALATFSDYYETQFFGGHTDENKKDEEFGCYKLYHHFSEDPDDFQRALARVLILGGGIPTENALGGVLFTLFDDRLGWKEEVKQDDETYTQRVIVIITDDISNSATDNWKFFDESRRTPPSPDVKNTCRDTLLPSYKMVGEELRKREVLPIGFFTEGVLRYWNYVFKNYWQIEKPYVHQFKLIEVDTLISDIETSVTNLVRCMIEMEDPIPQNTLGL